MNSSTAKLENERHLIKLYERNFSSLFDSIKKEYGNGELIKNLDKQKSIQKKAKYSFSKRKLF